MKPIRHRIFAHEEEFSNESEKTELLNKCEKEHFDNVLKRLMIVENILEQAGLNGKRLDYDYVPQRTKNLAEKEVNKLLSVLAASKGVEFDRFRKQE